MKKYIALSVLLIFATASFAQTSRKSAGKKSTKAKTELRTQKKSTSGKSSKASKSRSSSAKATKTVIPRSSARKSSVSDNRRSSAVKSRSSDRSIIKSITNLRNARKSSSSSSARQNNNRTSTIKKNPVRTGSRNAATSNSGRRINSIDRKAVRSSEANRSNSDALRKSNRKITGYATNSGIIRHPRIATHKGTWRYRTPVSIEIRRIRYAYRRPRVVNIYWTRNMYRDYAVYYPFHTSWEYSIGSNIETISAYDAAYYEGQVKRVYGKVEEVFYSPEDRNYYLYFGNPFPYHDFSVVISRRDAKRISVFPEWFFDNHHICVTGLISWFDDKPEIIVKNSSQIQRY